MKIHIWSSHNHLYKIKIKCTFTEAANNITEIKLQQRKKTCFSGTALQYIENSYYRLQRKMMIQWHKGKSLDQLPPCGHILSCEDVGSLSRMFPQKLLYLEMVLYRKFSSVYLFLDNFLFFFPFFLSLFLSFHLSILSSMFNALLKRQAYFPSQLLPLPLSS